MITLKEIAEASGVSVATASHILGNRADRYKKATRHRVNKTAADLGYRPNTSAQTMRSGCFNCFSLLLGSDSRKSGLFLPLIEGIQTGIEKRGLWLMTCRADDNTLTDSGAVHPLLRDCASDGFLIVYNIDIPDKMKTLILRYKIPAVWINSKQEADCIYPDEKRGAQQATEQLLALGHKRIAYADYSLGSDYTAHYSWLDRYAGYETAMQKAGLKPEYLNPGPRIPRSKRQEHALEWLASPDRPTAVLARTVTTAWPIMYAARQLGVRIPRDLSIMTFSSRKCDDTGTEVDCMIVPMQEMGERSVEKLSEKVKHPEQPMAPVVLPMKYLKGDTCAPPGINGEHT